MESRRFGKYIYPNEMHVVGAADVDGVGDGTRVLDGAADGVEMGMRLWMGWGRDIDVAGDGVGAWKWKWA